MRATARNRQRGIVACMVFGALIMSITARAQPVEGGRDSTLLGRLADRLDQSLISRCLTPETSQAMSRVVASGALRPILGTDYTLESGNVGGNEIRLQIKHINATIYDLVLAAPGTRSGTPDGQGQRFLFYAGSPPVPDAKTKETLLAVARAFDAAIPDSAFAPCAGGSEEKGDRRYPRRIALGSAIAEAMAVLVTILYGLLALRRFRHTAS